MSRERGRSVAAIVTKAAADGSTSPRPAISDSQHLVIGGAWPDRVFPHAVGFCAGLTRF
jgi:hypothetical protein